MSDDGRAPLLWYAMSSPYGREKKAEEALAKKAIECFVPRRRVETITGNRREVKFVTEVRNLIFVHTTEDTMRAIKPSMNDLLQFHTCPNCLGGRKPLIVPDKQMEDFIQLYRSRSDELIYLSPDEIHDLRENARVEIGDGLFKGMVGYYQRIKGKRSKYFVVRIKDFVACAILLVNCNFIKLPKEEE